jgi:uncharacterized protein YaaR (DUF327 family)
MVIFYVVVPYFLTRRADKQIREKKEKKAKAFSTILYEKQTDEREMRIEYCI